jgi:hypothetical protein
VAHLRQQQEQMMRSQAQAQAQAQPQPQPQPQVSRTQTAPILSRWPTPQAPPVPTVRAPSSLILEHVASIVDRS